MLTSICSFGVEDNLAIFKVLNTDEKDHLFQVWVVFRSDEWQRVLSCLMMIMFSRMGRALTLLTFIRFPMARQNIISLKNSINGSPNQCRDLSDAFEKYKA